MNVLKIPLFSEAIHQTSIRNNNPSEQPSIQFLIKTNPKKTPTHRISVPPHSPITMSSPSTDPDAVQSLLQSFDGLPVEIKGACATQLKQVEDQCRAVLPTEHFLQCQRLIKHIHQTLFHATEQQGPSIETPIKSEERTIFLQTLILTSLSLPLVSPSDPRSTETQTTNNKSEQIKRYTPIARALLSSIAYNLTPDLHTLPSAERSLALLLTHQLSSTTTHAPTNEPEKPKSLASRLVGPAAFVAGGLALGLTGGLAAPLIIGLLPASLGIVGSAATTTTIASVVGLTGGRLAQFRVERRFSDITEFEFHPTSHGSTAHNVPAGPKGMHATICVAGLIRDSEEWRAMWSEACAGPLADDDVYLLKYESATMVEAGRAANQWVQSKVISTVGTEILKRTAAQVYLSAIALPMTVYNTAASVLDSVFTRAMARSKQAGQLLATVIRQRQHGDRPLRLIGHGLGAVVIFHALLQLTKDDPNGAVAEYIDQVLLISLALAPSPAEWEQVQRAVAAPIVNAYTPSDYVLGLNARIHSISMNMAGLGPVTAPHIVNLNAAQYGDAHFGDATRMGNVLQAGLVPACFLPKDLDEKDSDKNIQET